LADGALLEETGERWYRVETGEGISYEVSLTSDDGHSAYIFGEDGVILQDPGYVIVDNSTHYTLTDPGTYYIGVAGTGTQSESVTLSIVPALEKSVYYAGTGNGTLTLPLGASTKDVYLIFSNPSDDNFASLPTVNSNLSGPQASVAHAPVSQPSRSVSGAVGAATPVSRPIAQRGKPEITQYNREVLQNLTRSTALTNRN